MDLANDEQIKRLTEQIQHEKDLNKYSNSPRNYAESLIARVTANARPIRFQPNTNPPGTASGTPKHSNT